MEIAIIYVKTIFEIPTHVVIFIANTDIRMNNATRSNKQSLNYHRSIVLKCICPPNPNYASYTNSRSTRIRSLKLSTTSQNIWIYFVDSSFSNSFIRYSDSSDDNKDMEKLKTERKNQMIQHHLLLLHFQYLANLPLQAFQKHQARHTRQITFQILQFITLYGRRNLHKINEKQMLDTNLQIYLHHLTLQLLNLFL